MKNINNYVREDALLILIGNKNDLTKERKVSKEEANKFMMDKNFDNYFEISALNNQNINDIVNYQNRI